MQGHVGSVASMSNKYTIVHTNAQYTAKFVKPNKTLKKMLLISTGASRAVCGFFFMQLE